MDVSVDTLPQATVVKISGDIDGNTAPVAQQQILPLATPGCKIVLDMTQVQYMSSAGLRMLLLVYRRIPAVNGKIVLVGLSEEIEEVMSVTGFLDFFQTADSLEAGVAAVNG